MAAGWRGLGERGDWIFESLNSNNVKYLTVDYFDPDLCLGK
jgi:hypothetical protein